MRLRLAAAFTIGLTWGCHDAPGPAPQIAQAVSATCEDATSEGYYFTSHSLIPEDPGADKQQRVALSSYLRALSAPSLSCRRGELEGYRLLWGGPNVGAVVATLSRREDGQWSAETVQFDIPLPNSGLSRTVRNRWMRVSTAGEVKELRDALAAAEFWTRQFSSGLGSSEDGTSWTLEGRRGNAYRAVSVIAASEPFQSAARCLVSLSGAPLNGQLR